LCHDRLLIPPHTEPAGWSRLRSLHVGGNDLLDSQLAALLSGCPALSSLSLERCNIGDGGAAALALALERCALTHLDASHCGISGDGAATLAAVLSASGGSLATLILSGNPLEESGVVALAGALAGASSLRTLELGECGMTAAALTALVRLPQLATLSAFGNRMGDAALQAVTAALSRTPRGFAGLHTLGLSGNALSCAALTKFLDTLKALPSEVRRPWQE